MISIFLFVIMMVIALDTAVEYSLTMDDAMKRELYATLVWRFIAILLIMIAIAR